MMSMVDPVAIVVETRRIDNECSLEKDFTELNPLMVIIPNCKVG